MKLEEDKKLRTATIYACIVAMVAVAALFIVFNIDSVGKIFDKLSKVIAPIVWGFCIAYLLNPVLKRIEQLFGLIKTKRQYPKLKRAASIIVTYILFATVVTLFMVAVIPALSDSYNDLMDKMGGYVASATEYVNDILNPDTENTGIISFIDGYIDLDNISDYISNFIAQSYAIFKDYAPVLISKAVLIVGQLMNFVLGIILSIYFLADRENIAAQFKKLTCAVFKPDTTQQIFNEAAYADKTFGGFIVGKIVDSTIVGIITFFVLMLFKMPYYPLIAVIVGAMNMIPFFGPIIAAIPSTFIIFIAEPIKALWFLIIILAIQQLDGNLIDPFITGGKTGISSFWVIIAITVMSGLLGLVGMFMGVPLFVIIYHLVSKLASYLIKRRGLDAPENALSSVKSGEEADIV
ncbi:MAG: AI-2E family transporter [Clostridiales bacterium]|nr:AI-2E family transporter [Clostridiales bacterium]